MYRLRITYFLSGIQGEYNESLRLEGRLLRPKNVEQARFAMTAVAGALAPHTLELQIFLEKKEPGKDYVTILTWSRGEFRSN